MTCILKNAKVYTKNGFITRDISIAMDGVNCCYDGVTVLPGFVDVHVHFREPGFLYKETIATGSKAAAHGGYCTVATMPNLKPVPDSVDHLEVELEAIRKHAVINVLPYGAISVNEAGEEMADLEGMASDIFAFSDDGKGVQSDVFMKEAMLRAKALGKIICAHCEDNALLHGGYIHDGIYAKEHGHKGICSESEWGQIKRDLELVRETGCAYHVCHISTKESVELIRNAKKEGLNVTCETGPHYLILTENDLHEEGRFKMNPPLRSIEDRDALIEGFLDGTIDMLATDHAPHSAEEKSRGLKDSLMGVVGIETAFPLMYTHFVKTGRMSLDTLMERMVYSPSKRFGLSVSPEHSFTVFDLESSYSIDPEKFVSMGHSTPFEGEHVFGECLLTICNDKVAWYKA